LADLLVSDVLVGVLLVGVSTALLEQLVIVLGLDVLPAQWAIGSAHGGISFAGSDGGEQVLTDATMLACLGHAGNTQTPIHKDEAARRIDDPLSGADAKRVGRSEPDS
jgi:hypothetical protein